MWKRCILSLERKREGVMNGDSGDDGRDELVCVGLEALKESDYDEGDGMKQK